MKTLWLDFYYNLPPQNGERFAAMIIDMPEEATQGEILQRTLQTILSTEVWEGMPKGGAVMISRLTPETALGIRTDYKGKLLQDAELVEGLRTEVEFREFS